MQDKYEKLKLDHQLCFPLYAAARKIVAAYTPYLKPLGLTYTQYIALLVLWEKDNVMVKELCSKLHLDNGTVVPVVKNLQKAGLVIKERVDGDERVVRIRLTEKGKEMREKAIDIPDKVSPCFNGISKEALTNLYATLYQILDSEKCSVE